MPYRKKLLFNSALITGTTGFVGRNFLSFIQKQFPEMKIDIAVRKTIEDNNINSSICQINMDLNKEIDILSFHDVVIHIAGEKRNEANMWNVNFEGTRRLLHWAINHRVKRFIYLSSVGVYGASHNFGRVDENTCHNPQNPYEVSKNAAEKLVKDLCAENGIEYVIIQPSNIIGWSAAGPYPLLGLMKIIKRKMFIYLGGGDKYLNYVAVEDVAAALSAAIQPNAGNSTFIVNSPVEIHVAVNIIADEIGVMIPKIKLPLIVGQAGVTIASIFSGISGVETSFTKGRLSELTNNTFYDSSNIISKCDFSYSVGIELGLRRLTRHYLNAGLL